MCSKHITAASTTTKPLINTSCFVHSHTHQDMKWIPEVKAPARSGKCPTFSFDPSKEHIQEIFATYGKIKMIDMPMNRVHPHLSKGYAYVEYETADEAEKALKHMDGGKRK